MVFASSTANDNDNDNDTLREVPHLSDEGLALQARASGPWPPRKRICLTGKNLLCWQGAKSICYGQSELHSGELEVQGRKGRKPAQAVAVLNSL